MRQCNYVLSRVMGMRKWLTVLNATETKQMDEVSVDFEFPGRFALAYEKRRIFMALD